ncbi:MAG: DUF393 domain-containing protein [Pirellulaceae bacterium]|nr:DUF393 domain-containing protein [Pirellulaceae bacterium]
MLQSRDPKHRSLKSTKDSQAVWRVEVFYDGDCPLCLREIRMLRRLDRDQRIRFTNLASSTFDPASLGKTTTELMNEIHGRFPDGRWIVGVEVFRQLYSAVGFGNLVRLTRLPIICHGLEVGYRLFAQHRLKLTGRCSANSGSCSA